MTAEEREGKKDGRRTKMGEGERACFLRVDVITM